MLGGVPIRRIVAAADVAARQAQAQMDPAVTGLQALLAATRRVRGVILRGSQMCAELHLAGHLSDDTPRALISSSGGEHARRDGGVP